MALLWTYNTWNTLKIVQISLNILYRYKCIKYEFIIYKYEYSCNIYVWLSHWRRNIFIKWVPPKSRGAPQIFLFLYFLLFFFLKQCLKQYKLVSDSLCSSCSSWMTVNFWKVCLRLYHLIFVVLEIEHFELCACWASVLYP